MRQRLLRKFVGAFKMKRVKLSLKLLILIFPLQSGKEEVKRRNRSL